MTSDFDSLSRGDQYLRLLQIEYESLLKDARFTVSWVREALEKYQYSDADRARMLASLAFARKSIKYFKELVKGAENGESDSIPSRTDEGKSLDKFEGINCTTV
jgi:hypothetical protein